MTREEWIARCSAVFVERGGLDKADADDVAAVCAASEQEASGDDMSDWTDPETVASDEMSYWDND